ncbi:serine acetyltransferase [archaeon]|jgi:serine O-acetyltransferase|nr:serine acetyltransferase [archaeon]MBT4022252.1 serine acetyltransferase [archaeon]MBT4272916.1 serine acetyltransferase [archaeon]MBT4460659.1 serine acetyltransferase [archaeon]MBT4857947.1 serine acetyltransferase [archaeon]
MTKFTGPKEELIVLIYRFSYFFRKIKPLAVLISYINSIIFSIDISPFAIIGKNFRINHGLGTVIGPCVIGDNVNIKQGVTIGNKKNGIQKFPRIGNNVNIYANAMILGDIKIGNNVIIGAMCFIDKDIPNNSVVYNKRDLVIRKIK